MVRLRFFAFVFFLAGCGGNSAVNKAGQEDENAQPFALLFKEMTPPYALSDSGILANKDTTQLRSDAWASLIPDSIAVQLFGKKDRIRYTPLAQFKGKKEEVYYLAKASRDKKVAALLVVRPAGDSTSAVLPFIVPDEDKSTKQISSMEANFSVVRSVVRTLPDDTFQDGKDVYAYSGIGKTFDLVMTDPLEDKQLELINPIDTMASTYKHAGDYAKNKRNIVSIRDGRKKGLITVFIHIEDKEGACTGEIKGDAEIINEETAIYRTAGDPCVLTIKFSKQGVTLEEQEGCGSRRGRECSFNGTFSRKRQATAASKKGA